MESENTGLLMDNLFLAKKVQLLALDFFSEGNSMHYTNVEEWQEMQRKLAQYMNVLVRKEGSTAEEEAELLLAILMGYCVTMRNSQHIEEALVRVEKVLPFIKDKILKCHLMVFCYGEYPDEVLADEIYLLMEELKAEGKGEEIRLVEGLLETMIEC